MKNPYDEAFSRVGGALDGIVGNLGPPRRVKKPLERFRRQMSDVSAHHRELRAILRLFGEDGFQSYVDDMSKVDEQWK